MVHAAPLFVHLLRIDFRRQVLHQDLDARLVLVVAAAMQVVDPQRGLQIGQQVLPFDEGVDQLADDGRAAHAAADPDAETELAVALDRLQADVVHADRRAVLHRAADRDLELARQEGEFGVSEITNP